MTIRSYAAKLICSIFFSPWLLKRWNLLSRVVKAIGKYKIRNAKFKSCKKKFIKLRVNGKFYLEKSIFSFSIIVFCFTFFKISISAIHLNPLKIPTTEIHERLPYFFINDVG